ncbi:MAG: hypothetical protein ACREO7_03195 [Pseudoxanthomonas sp.]
MHQQMETGITGSQDLGACRLALRRLSSAALALTLLIAPVAFADSWMLPTTHEYLSADQQARLTVTPRELSSQVDFFRDKVDGKASAGQRPGNAATTASGKLERKEADGKWKVVWQHALVNDVSPTSALVADQGKYIVTFDNWHSVGFGDDVVVIYDAAGKRLRSMALTDFLPQDYVQALPRSVSSRHWGYQHRLADNDETLLLHVVVPEEESPGRREQEPSFIDIRVRLADGAVTAPSGPAWEQALASAARVRAMQEEEERAFRARRAAPLSAPGSDDQNAWREYLTELMVRSTSDLQDFPRLYLLPAERDPDYSKRRAMISSVIASSFHMQFARPGHAYFSSPASARLAELLAEELGKLLPVALQGYEITFVGEAGLDAKVQAAALRAGAKYSFVDVSKPIPGQSLPDRGADGE